jgi:hypothetical protein
MTVVARKLIVFFAGLLAGCGSSAPPSIDTTSDAFETLGDKVTVLERHVTFRRTYRSLEFYLDYKNGTGMVPGPSEWDIGLIATVSADELDA